MNRLLLPLALLVAPFLPQRAAAWGPVAQKTVNQLAIYGLPSGMQPFYYHFRQQLVDRALEPDGRVGKDPHEAARHHIDIERVTLPVFLSMPMEWESAAGKYSADSLYKIGIAPWATLTAYEHLIEAFKEGSPDNVLKYSIEVANYIGDLHVPLHTNERYSAEIGSLTGLLEGKLIERNLDKFKLYDGEAKSLKPELAGPLVWTVVKESYGLADPVWDLENDISKDFTPKDKFTYTYKLGKATRAYSDKFADAYFDKVGGMMAARLKSSSEATAMLWYSAWDAAGKPNLEKMVGEDFPKQERGELARDLKLRKEFKLVPEGRLLALAKPAAAPTLGQEAEPAKTEPGKSAADDGPAPTEEGKGKKKKEKKEKAKRTAGDDNPGTEATSPGKE
ncbi:MAG: hypothetical protein H7330_00805 [Hymenobacteraceae bacterium]|nr:hypothetical protein [Hymenobacteraceae bacterium]